MPPNPPSTPDDPSALLRRVGQRDREAFRALYANLGPRVKGFLHGFCGDPARADELTQETFLAVWRRAADYDPTRASAETWIFTIARHRAIDSHRRLQVAYPDPRDPAWAPDPPPTSDTLVDARQRAERVQQALDGLPPAQREVLHQAFYESRSYATIAAAEGVAVGTIKSRARLAFERLRERLAAEGR